MKLSQLPISCKQIQQNGRGMSLTKAIFSPQKYRGEHHGVLSLSDGSYSKANYTGPGTNVIKRLQDNEQGLTPIDNVAKRHDIDYMLARDTNDIRDADNRMIRKIQNVNDSTMNKTQASAIKAKTYLENLGVLNRERFSGKLPLKNTPDEISLLMSHREDLKQKGYGPGERLMKMAVGGGLKSAGSKGKGLKSAGGKGLRLAGQKKIHDRIISQLEREMNIKGLRKKIDYKQYGKGKGNMTNEITKRLLPIVALKYLKTKGMRGKGLVKDVMGKIYKNREVLLKLMKLGIETYLKTQKGSGFFSKFKDGLKNTFTLKNVASVAKKVITPENILLGAKLATMVL